MGSQVLTLLDRPYPEIVRPGLGVGVVGRSSFDHYRTFCSSEVTLESESLKVCCQRIELFRRPEEKLLNQGPTFVSPS